eukprot:GEMP01021620.1.p1 GENE.GEMP01021620.1~~GEMP01021620.1.p1  ORF type:complete len:431 (+),score=27.71 GEMP01021620.1:247-1539(+)
MWCFARGFCNVARLSTASSRFRAFEEARTFARTLKLYTVKEWRAWSRTDARPHDIPSNPNSKYAGMGWVSYPDFLGKTDGKRGEVEGSSSIGNEVDCSVSNAIHARGVDLVLTQVKKCAGHDIIKLQGSARANLIVREPGSSEWVGIAVKSSTSRVDASGRISFFGSADSAGMIVVLVSLREPLRFWARVDVKCGSGLKVYPNGSKWKQFEFALEDLPHWICQCLKRDDLSKFSQSTWTTPRSPTNQLEYLLHKEAIKNIFNPLGCGEVEYPKPRHAVFDYTINGLSIQCKTASQVIGRRSFTCHLRKRGGRIQGKRMSQPYSADDNIDVFMINIRSQFQLLGVFIFSKNEALEAGWLRGEAHKGKLIIYLYPPFVQLMPHLDAKHGWQRNCYLDLAGESLDIERAKKLFSKCQQHKRDAREGANFLVAN